MEEDFVRALQQIGSVLGDLLSPNELVPSSPIDIALGGFFTRVSALAARQPSPPSIALIGASKCGRSTLLNALLGRSIIPTSNVPGKWKDLAHAIRMHASYALILGVCPLNCSYLTLLPIRRDGAPLHDPVAGDSDSACNPPNRLHR